MSPLRPGLSIRVWSIAILFFLIAPVIVIFPIALNPTSYVTFPPSGLSSRWFEKILENPAWMDGFIISVKVAFATMLISVCTGLLAAIALVRYSIKGKGIIYALLLLPMIVPTIITAIAVYFFFAELDMVGSFIALSLAHSVAAVPIAVIILSATLQGFDIRIEQAALSLGASPFVAFQRVTLPIIAPGVASAAIFTFLFSFDELLLSLFLSSTQTQTLPVLIWNAVAFQLDPTIAAVSAILILISVFALALAQLARRQRS